MPNTCHWMTVAASLDECPQWCIASGVAVMIIIIRTYAKAILTDGLLSSCLR